MGSNKTRNWCFTINNYDDANIESLATVDAKYLCFGREVGEQGTPHLQGFVQFKNARRFDSVRSCLPDGAHIEPCKGSAVQNVKYCEKDGDFTERGTRPISNKRKGEMEQERWSEVITMCKEGDLNAVAEEYPQVFIGHYRTLKMIKKDYMPSVPDADELSGVWYYGAPGTGKSYTARQVFTGGYLKMCNKWWDGYQDEEYVIIDDVDTNHKCLGHHFKIWADRYAFLAETKGGTIRIRPAKIVVTSQYSIEEIWAGDQATIDALKRRFTVRHFSGFFRFNENNFDGLLNAINN